MHDQPLWGLALISDESQKLAIDGGLGCSVDVAREIMHISSCIKTIQCEFRESSKGGVDQNNRSASALREERRKPVRMEVLLREQGQTR